MAFAYLKDPMFLACFCLYWINRDLEYFRLSTPLLESYLNDIVCIPFWVPIMLWLARKIGLRQHDRSPEGFEIVIPLVLWAVLFEVVIPRQGNCVVPAVADPYDVLCYCVGSLLAVTFWRYQYGSSVAGAGPAQADADAKSLRVGTTDRLGGGG